MIQDAQVPPGELRFEGNPRGAVAYVSQEQVQLMAAPLDTKLIGNS